MPTWQPPALGVSVRVSDVPAVESLADRGSKIWAMAAALCRYYDAAHGTTSSITQTSPGDPMNRIVADTPCLKGDGGTAVAY